MSLAIWPPLAPDALKADVAATQNRELAWLLNEMGDDLRTLQTSLRDCYNLLVPAEAGAAGNTLVVSTPRHETVKGHITRLGTRITRGTIHLKMRTLPAQTLSIDRAHPLTIAPLGDLQVLLARSIDLLGITLVHAYPGGEGEEKKGGGADPSKTSAPPRVELFLTAQLRVLAQALQDAAALLQGPPRADTDAAWSTRSAAPSHFAPPLAPGISFYLGLQDSQLVLWLRSVEPADAPVNLGMKFALALGTARRIEHDEVDQVFTYCCEDGCARGLHPPPSSPPTPPPPPPAATTTTGGTASPPPPDEGPARVLVREKIRVESADPSLLSLSAKLNALSFALLQTRRNLAAVMGEELEE